MKIVVLKRTIPSNATRGMLLVSARGSDEEAPSRGIQIEVRDDPTGKDLSDLQRDPDVQAAAPSIPMRLIRPAKIGDPVLGAPGEIAWGVRAVGADTSPRTGKGVKVAVLDTGIDRKHPAFEGIKFTVKNFTGGVPDDVQDIDGHGTHCAATIFGRNVDGMRIGIAPGVTEAVIAKVVGEEGSTLEEIAKATAWAYAEEAHILSISLGIDFDSHRDSFIKQGIPSPQATSLALSDYGACLRLFDRLFDFMADRYHIYRGMLVVAAAGNESSRPHYRVKVAPPADAHGIISVGAVCRKEDGTYAVADFSNQGPQFCAPGVGILSARSGGGLESRDGTSMAAPHAAGVAALWAEAKVATASPGRFRSDLVLRDIEDSVKKIDGFDPDDIGAGLVQAP
ncbi:MAG TPA: S8 family serine peptidase [Nitrosospira sp.]|nr:S8 family serine peptidase [Nitrosospira sp.]